MPRRPVGRHPSPKTKDEPQPADMATRDFEAELLAGFFRLSPGWAEIERALAPLVEDLSLGIAADATDAIETSSAAPAAIDLLFRTRSNQPTEPMAPETLLDLLKERHTPLTKRQAELLAAAERFDKTYPKIETEEVAGKAAQFVGQLSALIKAGEAAHTPEKAPWLTLGRTCDAFFKKLIEPIIAAKAAVVVKQTAFAKIIAEANRKKAADEAAAKQREADAAMALARQNMTSETLDEAAAKSQEAADAADHAAARPAEHSRVRGDYGAVASLVVRWKIRAATNWHGVLDPIYLMPDQGALDLALKNAPRQKDGTPILSIPGTELYSEESVRNVG